MNAKVAIRFTLPILHHVLFPFPIPVFGKIYVPIATRFSREPIGFPCRGTFPAELRSRVIFSDEIMNLWRAAFIQHPKCNIGDASLPDTCIPSCHTHG